VNVNPPSSPHEESDHHPDRSPQNARSHLAAATRLSGACDSIHFGPEWKSKLPAAREGELKRLTAEASAPAPPEPSSQFLGGEHEVWVSIPPTTVFKHTVPGFYGRILDETVLLDPRTFQNRRKLAMRGALPSEYLRRWAVAETVFGLETLYCGVVNPSAAEPQMAVSQTYIDQFADDPATEADVSAFFIANNFTQVGADLIVNPEIQNVTWYRQRDGILITDAHPRNFRKDTTGVLIPIDLVITLVPCGLSKLLPEPERPWSIEDWESPLET
jgi:hypothetical protein